jgi:hypothetical protein
MFEAQKASVLTVGAGRGFVVESGANRYVLTAAHCMVSSIKEDLPPCIAAAGAEELTYPKLLSPLGGDPWVWAQCLFVDPTADIGRLATRHSKKRSKRSRASSPRKAKPARGGHDHR